MSKAMTGVMNEQQRHYLEAMGIQVWERRAPACEVQGSTIEVQSSMAVETEQLPAGHEVNVEEMGERTDPLEYAPVGLEPLTSNPAPEDDLDSLGWSALEQRVRECRKCPELAASSRIQTALVSGNLEADWLVVGDFPENGQDGRPEAFSGQAARLLSAMLVAIGLHREQAVLATALKCSPGNREPLAEEAAVCAPYLQRQITLLQPKIILAAGRIAAQALLRTDAGIDSLRGRIHRLQSGVPLVVTRSPEELLRSPQDKRKAWADLCLARAALLAGGRSEA